ncbi:single-stranded DNA-binding protein [Glaciimonas sp. PCH181]|uniref:single-stranded DNA-binding protein n=1 Tax=Glaciimonas sp. PCH181 TaxID=2133943 RepID=UPI000D3CD4E0|nr:single-stranded DNA-binding protein [Glaciimonas sp. PCH181]PUA19021.1 single-stranded DNA-binding protein [Glaciimonas sp. PCH181]
MSDPKAPLKANQALVVGRIDNVRVFEVSGKRTFESRVMQPAPDSFTSPTAVAVMSHQKLGSPGDDVSVLVSVAGFRDHYKDKDGNAVQTARNTLRVVE